LFAFQRCHLLVCKCSSKRFCDDYSAVQCGGVWRPTGVPCCRHLSALCKLHTTQLRVEWSIAGHDRGKRSLSLFCLATQKLSLMLGIEPIAFTCHAIRLSHINLPDTAGRYKYRVLSHTSNLRSSLDSKQGDNFP
jgi:hypothetical protein